MSLTRTWAFNYRVSSEQMQEQLLQEFALSKQTYHNH